MRYGVPVFRDRIAPRCTIARGVLVITCNGSRVTDTEFVELESSDWMELITTFKNYRVDTLVCGGIAKDKKMFLLSSAIDVIENVACTTDEILSAIENGHLCPGFGFGSTSPGRGDGPPPEAEPGRIDCLACRDRLCERGLACPAWDGVQAPECHGRDDSILESARDIAMEAERNLCRLSEVIYFCLEMKYRRLGIAYCSDLFDSTRILAGILGRFFEVVPVCCKIGGLIVSDPLVPNGRPPKPVSIACNPRGQASALAAAGTDFNVSVGLCVGVDCVFAEASSVPVTTLFVKDRSLANNPIGALYSDYYLKEAIRSPMTRIESQS